MKRRTAKQISQVEKREKKDYKEKGLRNEKVKEKTEKRKIKSNEECFKGKFVVCFILRIRQEQKDRGSCRMKVSGVFR